MTPYRQKHDDMNRWLDEPSSRELLVQACTGKCTVFAAASVLARLVLCTRSQTGCTNQSVDQLASKLMMKPSMVKRCLDVLTAAGIILTVSKGAKGLPSLRKVLFLADLDAVDNSSVENQRSSVGAQRSSVGAQRSSVTEPHLDIYLDSTKSGFSHLEKKGQTKTALTKEEIEADRQAALWANFDPHVAKAALKAALVESQTARRKELLPLVADAVAEHMWQTADRNGQNGGVRNAAAVKAKRGYRDKALAHADAILRGNPQVVTALVAGKISPDDPDLVTLLAAYSAGESANRATWGALFAKTGREKYV